MDHRFYICILVLLIMAGFCPAQEAGPGPSNPFGEEWKPQAPPDSVVVDTTSTPAHPPVDSLALVSAAKDTVPVMPRIVKPVIHALHADTSLYLGNDYGSFKDVFGWLSGTYLQDHGVIGDDSRGALFAGVPGEFELYYDFLNLNDPWSGMADLNLVPVQGVGTIEPVIDHASGNYGNTAAGQTLAVSSLDIAAFPPRSTVSYRTGQTEFSDIDVRVGLFTSEKMQINAGGLLKSYMGRVDRNHYEGQKLNLQVRRDLGRKWELDYLYLQNQDELDVPVLQYASHYNLIKPHQTIKRYDQGLAVHYSNALSAGMQYTNYRRDYYDLYLGSRDYYQTQKSESYRIFGRGRYRLLGFDINGGVEYSGQQLIETFINKYRNTQYQGWLNAGYNRQDFSLNLGLRQIFMSERDESYTLPEISASWRPGKGLTGYAWANMYVRQPSFEALHGAGPFYMGNPDLKTAEYQQAGGGIELEWAGLHAWTGISGLYVENQVAIYADADQDTGRFFNQAAHTRYALDWAVDYTWRYGFSAMVKGKYTYITSDVENFDITNYPAAYGQGYLQYHNLFFDGDLDLTVRVGAMLTGESFTPERYYAQYPLSQWLTDPIMTPFLLITPRVKSMTLFFSFQNLTNTDYQRVFAYPMPIYEFKWGFTWNFYD